MIHGNSRDPVLIKKISLNLWLLKDEVQSVLKDKLDKSEGDSSKIPLKDLKSEYAGSTNDDTDSPAEVGIVDASELDTGEDEMAKAIAEAEAEEAAKADSGDSEEPAEVEDTSADDMAAAMLEGQGTEAEVVEIKPENIGYIQRRPSVPVDKMYKGRTILSEVDIKNMYFFCNKSFMEGQSVVVEFLIPKRFVLNAEILYCRQYNLKSRIISENKLPYRVVIKWSFLKEGEKTLLRRFLQSVEPDVPEEVAPVQVAGGGGGGDDDDDFDELDDLDL